MWVHSTEAHIKICQPGSQAEIETQVQRTIAFMMVQGHWSVFCSLESLKANEYLVAIEGSLGMGLAIEQLKQL